MTKPPVLPSGMSSRLKDNGQHVFGEKKRLNDLLELDINQTGNASIRKGKLDTCISEHEMIRSVGIYY